VTVVKFKPHHLNCVRTLLRKNNKNSFQLKTLLFFVIYVHSKREEKK